MITVNENYLGAIFKDDDEMNRSIDRHVQHISLRNWVIQLKEIDS